MLRSNTFLEEKNDHLPREGLLWGNVAGPTSLVGGSSSEVQASPSGSPLKMSFKKRRNMRQKQNSETGRGSRSLCCRIFCHSTLETVGLREADKETKGSHRGIVGALCLGGSGEGDRVGRRRTSKRLSKERHYGLLSKFCYNYSNGFNKSAICSCDVQCQLSHASVKVFLPLRVSNKKRALAAGHSIKPHLAGVGAGALVLF